MFQWIDCNSLKKSVLPAALLLLLPILYFLYEPGLSAGFFFDDHPHLSALTTVNDAQTALTYILESNAGPLRRPVSFATFIVSAHCYPDTPRCFQFENVLIHLLNAVLAFWLCWRLLLHVRVPIKQPLKISLLIAFLWAALPLNAATTLIVIQRMTSLSALLVLAGLITYLYGRENLSVSNKKGFLLMGLGFLLGAGLSSFAKENGVLFPFFILVMELTLLREPLYRRGTGVKLFFGSFVVLPILVVLGYILWTLPTIIDSYQYRSFNMAERLLTESRVLWLYTKLTLLPRAIEIAPFYDGYTVSHSLLAPATTLLSIAGWITISILVYTIRKTYPSLLFGLTWYFAGHFLEAGVHSLELVFLHRNYLPSFGLLLGVIVALYQYISKKGMYRVFIFACTIYSGFLAAVLWNTTSLWGEPPTAARLWHQYFPDSSRAAQYLTIAHSAHGETSDAVLVIEQAWRRHPERSDLAMQTIQMSCYGATPTREVLNIVASTLNTTEFSYAATVTVEKMMMIIGTGECRHPFSYTDVDLLIDKLIENPSFERMHLEISKLLKYKAKIHLFEGDIKGGISALKKALNYSNLLNDYIQLARLYWSTGDREKSRETLDTASANAPLDPIRNARWLDQIEKEQAALEKLK